MILNYLTGKISIFLAICSETQNSTSNFNFGVLSQQNLQTARYFDLCARISNSLSFSFESTKKSEIFLKYSPYLLDCVRIVGRILPSDLMSRCAGPGRFFMLNFGWILCTPVHFSALISTVEKRLPEIH